VKQPLIRQAVESDIRFIHRLQQQWSEEGSVYGFVPESQEQVKAALNSYLLVAETSNEIVGFISGSVHRSEGTAVIPEGESYLEIDNLYILPEYRKKGIGGDLITRCLAQAKEAGVPYALLYSAAKDIHSILRFYEKHNFQSWNVQMFRKL
jgi:N-acetylglutamate synthase-like GNAT family acetyltransferase